MKKAAQLSPTVGVDIMAYPKKDMCKKLKSRAMLFYRLLQNAVQVETSTYDDIIVKSE